MTKIYTKTGDRGKTSLFNGQRVLKSNERVKTYGTVDELNSVIGVVLAEYQKTKNKNQKYKEKIQNDLLNVQADLLTIGAALANPSSEPLESLVSRVSAFEALIDALTHELPQLRNFILPGGSIAGAQLHYARTVTRRCERQIIALAQIETVDHNIIIYFNRLSDLLFTMARFVNLQEKVKETVWRKNT